MLEVRDLKVSYDGVLAVSKVSLDVREGSIVALVGGNGNGKSTTLRAIAGLNAADKGSIKLAGIDIGVMPAHKRVTQGICLVPEGRKIFAKLTVERNLQLGAYTRDDPHEVAASIDRMYSLFPILKERRHQLAGTMSGGEQQMLAISRGLMAKPKMLMLDEPSWGIAPKFVSKVLDTIQKVNAEGVSILLVEQSLHKALTIAHYGYVIQTGAIVMEGKATELLDNEDIKKAYLGL
ncbi:ABC transporter ATP-binding protein [Noviherbaspirillum pedocola]|uniref:ABC transporter ATP-binding protein n=1 Tax=Noviherbaspirillum pedocola TaxID=2801341 RepID=A0A934W832_9BURK|nr:ABC transporter ATP-binding protein [Noviherbaspirillum pedocola]MBK4738132.1 ABC transporter ATP-binding protein [Noviherbaspirillum pedocola]